MYLFVALARRDTFFVRRQSLPARLERVRDLHNRKKALPRPALNFRHQCARLSVPADFSRVSGNYRIYPIEVFRGAQRNNARSPRATRLSVATFALSARFIAADIPTFALGGETLTRMSYARSKVTFIRALMDYLHVPRLERARRFALNASSVR